MTFHWNHTDDRRNWEGFERLCKILNFINSGAADKIKIVMQNLISAKPTFKSVLNPAHNELNTKDKGQVRVQERFTRILGIKRCSCEEMIKNPRCFHMPEKAWKRFTKSGKGGIRKHFLHSELLWSGTWCTKAKLKRKLHKGEQARLGS